MRLETSAAVQTAANQQQEMVQTYCVTCHSTRAKMGGLALEGLNLQAAADNAEIWEKALRKLRGNQMPPPGSPQPPQKDVESFVAWMENALDTNAKGPKAGYVPIQRLNRTEYAASVKALVGVDVNPKDVLPQDIQVEGFDNIADALSVSPAFLDQYVTAARHIAQIAVGNPNPRVSSVKYPIDANQNPDDPPPLGTWGGMKFKHSFPADGEYQITLTNLAVGPYSNALERENTVVILIDGRTVFRQSIGGAADLSLVDRTAGTGRSQVMDRFSKIPVQVKAGVRDVVVAFVDRPHVETSENLQRLQPYGGLTGGAAPTDRRPHLLDGVAVAGPFNPTGVSMTASRALIFVCDPKQTGEPACARQITEHLARRAFRRPVTTEDVNRLVPFYEAERRNGGTFDQGIEQTVAAVLVSPQFLYRSIRGPKGVTPNTEFSLTDLELASRLSFFLWNTGPDEELLTLASSNGLTRPGVMEQQARRMLADPRASSLVTSFAMKWLNLTTLDQVVPDPNLFRGFNEQLRRDFSTEAQAFIGSVFSEDRSVVDLLTADYTFLNDRLASHYGISGVTGAQFRKVTLTDKNAFRPAGQGCGAAADVVRRPHVSGLAWSVGARQADGHAADAAPARYRDRPLTEGRRAAQDGPREAGAASRQGDVPDVSWRDRSDRPGVGELRRDRAMADEGQRGQRSDRCQHGAADGSRDQRRGGTPRATGRASGRVRADRDGEIDDVRRQPTTGVFRYAAGSRHRSVSGEGQLHAVVNRLGNRQ